MANHNRDELENNSKTGTGVGVALVAGVFGAILAAGKASSNKKSELQQINAEISDIDRQISDYKSGLLGSIVHSEEIAELEQKRAQLVARRNKLIK